MVIADMVIQPGTPLPLENGSWFDNMVVISYGRSQNTVPIASTQVAIKGTVQYSTRR